MRLVRRGAVVVVCGLVAAGCATAETPETANPDLPAVPLTATYGSTDLSTFDALVRQAYVVARGRFVAGPTVVGPAPENEEFASELVMWEFVPDEVYRDVRVDDAPARVAEEQRGSILVVGRANMVGRSRGDEPVERFLGTAPSEANLNSYPLDRTLYLFLRPGAAPREAVERDPDLAHVMYVPGTVHCYLVEDLGRSCGYISDRAGGEPVAVPEEGSLVPSGLTREAIERSGSVPEVVSSGPEEVDPLVDAERYVALPAVSYD